MIFESDLMLADAVRLPEVDEMIDIEDITTQEDRETAKKSREEMGKHVIPVPALQLKREFAGYFIYPLKIFRGWGRGQELEKTVRKSCGPGCSAARVAQSSPAPRRSCPVAVGSIVAVGVGESAGVDVLDIAFGKSDLLDFGVSAERA